MPGLGLTACALLCDPWCGVLVSWWVVSGMPYPGVCSVVLLPAPWLSDASSWMIPVILMSAMHGVWGPHIPVCIFCSKHVVV